MKNLWAPWRSEYVRKIDIPKEDGCFICNAAKSNDEKQSLVLEKDKNSFTMMNRYPYNPGHLMVCCNRHIGNIEDVKAETSAEIWQGVCRCKFVLKEVMSPQGFNIGINQGRCAGAGVADHLHVHIVPRWNGDSNFMPVCANTRIMSQSLEELYSLLKDVFDKSGS